VESVTRKAPFCAFHRSTPEVRLSFRDYIRESVKGRIPVNTNTVSIDRSLLVQSGGFPEGRCIRGGDRELWLRLISLTDEVVCITKPTTVYNRFSSTVTVRTPIVAKNDCVRKWIVAHLVTVRGPYLKFLLRKYANENVSRGLSTAMRHGNVKPKHLAYLYATPNPLRFTLYALVSVLPRKLQIRSSRAVLMIRSALRYGNQVS
jgi:succinoglycan biosynthesis protein ExoO